MTMRLVLLGATALLLTSCNAQPDTAAEPAAEATSGTSSAADETAIRDTITRWGELIKAKDAAAIAQLYTVDGAVMPPNSPIGKGHQAIEQTWTGMMATPGFELEILPEQIVVSDSGDMAMDRGTYRLKMEPDGEPMSDTGKYIVVWRKVGGEWKAAGDIFNSDMPAGG